MMKWLWLRRWLERSKGARMKILVTGSSGLIGSEAVTHYEASGHDVIGIDNNLRKKFFGEDGDTTWNLHRLLSTTRSFEHIAADIRDYPALEHVFRTHRFDAIIHCAAQPSHDLAKDFPIVDFEINALGTVNLLELTRQYCPDAIFIFMSTNKVYGDAPNEIPITELVTRWEYARDEDRDGIAESCRVDQSLHSLFGASKAAADIVAQEYGRYFGMRVGIFRGGCLTGPSHSGVELHGFLSYLVKATVEGRAYKVFGYKGKQVRDQIHARDVIAAFDEFIRNPRCGEVYNIGGGRPNSASVIESIDMVEQLSGYKLHWTYVEESRRGDHICYISDLRKLRSHFPTWSISTTLEGMIVELIQTARASVKPQPSWKTE
jgi:CDP-paratose 2-epimerase